MTETAWPRKPKIFTISPLQKVFIKPQSKAKDPEQHKCPLVENHYSIINFHTKKYYEALEKKEAYVHPAAGNYL